MTPTKHNNNNDDSNKNKDKNNNNNDYKDKSTMTRHLFLLLPEVDRRQLSASPPAPALISDAFGVKNTKK